MSSEPLETNMMLPVTQEDLAKAGFAAASPMVPGLAVFFNDALFQRCTTLARIMSKAEGVMPKHLIGRPEACFAIISRAITWNLDPYAVAMSTYQTPGGSVGFEGKLIQAILENSGKLEGNVEFEHQGDWEKVKGKFKIVESQKGGKYPSPTWTREDAKGCKVIVSAQVKGEKKKRTLPFDLETAFPLNSPLWATAPERQVCYTAVRAFANQAMPGILMGMSFDYDHGSPFAEMTNITPPRPTKSGGEFDRPETTDLHKDTTKAEAPKPAKETPKPSEPESVVKETVETKDTAKAEVQTPPKEDAPAEQPTAANPEPEKTPEQPAVPDEPPPLDDAPSAAETDTWYKAQLEEVEKTKEVSHLFDLRQIVGERIEEARFTEFKKLCGARAGVILRGELADCKEVREVTGLRTKYSATLGPGLAEWFNKQCDDRQRDILSAKAKKK